MYQIVRLMLNDAGDIIARRPLQASRPRGGDSEK